jgi:hypothetical protein
MYTRIFGRRAISLAALSVAFALFAPVVFAQNCGQGMQPCNGRCIPETSLCILEPVPGGIDEIPAEGIGFASTLFYYINNGVWQWAFGIGIAIAVLNGAIGGLQIVLSNGDSGKIDAGKTRFISSAIGLIVLLLTGAILEFINPLGFING